MPTKTTLILTCLKCIEDWLEESGQVEEED